MTSAQAQATIGLFSSVGTHLSPFRPKVPTPVPMLRLDHPHPTGARSGFGGPGQTTSEVVAWRAKILGLRGCRHVWNRGNMRLGAAMGSGVMDNGRSS